MGKVLQFHHGKDAEGIGVYLAKHKGKTKMSVSLIITEDGSGHVWYSVKDRSDFILALGELALLKQYLIEEFHGSS